METLKSIFWSIVCMLVIFLTMAFIQYVRVETGVALTKGKEQQIKELCLKKNYDFCLETTDDSIRTFKLKEQTDGKCN